MYICTLCRFEMSLDDTVVHRADGSCICLRCYYRETDSGRSMPSRLRESLIATLAGVDAA
jgi:hypothetical protein